MPNSPRKPAPRKPIKRNLEIVNRAAPPVSTKKEFYGPGIPGVDPKELRGRLIVIEGADGSGRSTQIGRLTKWLETRGHATIAVGIKRSSLVSEELEEAKRGNILGRTTMSLFYATDFADQLENTIIPALKAGFMVVADRYIYTLMVRDLVRGVEEAWLDNVYGIALKPDVVFYLKVSPERLVMRNFSKHFALDYWESGMDLGLSRDMFDSFTRYQSLVTGQFKKLQKKFQFDMIDGNRSVNEVYEELREKIQQRIEPVTDTTDANPSHI